MGLKKGYKNQLDQLREDGLLGCSEDPFWNPKISRHECCGATRSYYNKKGCPACRDLTDKEIINYKIKDMDKIKCKMCLKRMTTQEDWKTEEEKEYCFTCFSFRNSMEIVKKAFQHIAQDRNIPVNIIITYQRNESK
jgi:hypothetical protein